MRNEWKVFKNGYMTYNNHEFDLTPEDLKSCSYNAIKRGLPLGVRKSFKIAYLTAIAYAIRKKP
jgi:hypothetical protein